MVLFKLQIGLVKTGKTTGGLTTNTPYYYQHKIKMIKN